MEGGREGKGRGKGGDKREKGRGNGGEGVDIAWPDI